jgi:hypothetical protein
MNNNEINNINYTYNNKWLVKEDIKILNYRYKLYYYWIGISNNIIHKSKYIEFKSRLNTILNKTNLMIYNKKNVINYNISLVEIIEIFLLLDNIIIEYYDLLWCTNSPIDNYLRKYFFIRDISCPIIKYSEEYSLEKIKKNEDIIINNINNIVNEITILSEFIKISINKNDELLYKLCLMILNSFIFIGQFIWQRYNLIIIHN